jgi:hypothetical protein
MDFVFIGAIVGFFVLTVGLVRLCAGLMDKGGRPCSARSQMHCSSPRSRGRDGDGGRVRLPSASPTASRPTANIRRRHP